MSTFEKNNTWNKIPIPNKLCIVTLFIDVGISLKILLKHIHIKLLLKGFKNEYKN